ncbi:MAG TPA: mucoidy inhibitor MuiA family protein [Anaeromyxobacter sp.]
MRLLALVLLAVPSLSLGSPAVNAPSRIDAVTVYRSGARVSRVARVELLGGPARLVFDGFPDGLDDDSIRIEGKGTAKARVFGVTVERITSEEAVAGEARAAEEKLERLQDEDRGLDDRIKAAQSRLEFVRSLRSTYSEERAKNLAVRAVAAREWSDLAAFVAGELQEGTQEVRRAEVARRELARRVAQARADLDKVQAKRGKTSKRVVVEVDSDRAGALELGLSYAVGAAGWQPVWDARLVPDAGTMELAFLGSVWQRTGEDWSDVSLRVSTAQPARGLFVPQLEPRYLARAEPPRPMLQRRERGMPMPSAPAMARSAAPEAEAYQLDEAKVAVEIPQATVEEGLLSASFTTPRRETVDGSGQARKVSLARFPLKAEIVRTAAPRVEAAAFLTAKAVNETGFPLLAGTAGVYLGDEFVGRAAIAATPPGGELQLAFGADDRIEIDRKVLERRRESAGIISKDEVYRYRVRIGVKNRYAAPVAVKLLDLVPVSRDEKIEVKVLEGTTAATREDPERPGVKVWELALTPREEKVVELRYEVRYPRGFPIAGLE